MDYAMDPVVVGIKRTPLRQDDRGYAAETLRCFCDFTTKSTAEAVVHGYAAHAWRRPAERWSPARKPRAKAA